MKRLIFFTDSAEWLFGYPYATARVVKKFETGATEEHTPQPSSQISVLHLAPPKAAERLQETGCRAKIVFLTVHDDADFARAALATGALGYVVKPRLVSDLIVAINEALAGRTFVSPSDTLGNLSQP